MKLAALQTSLKTQQEAWDKTVSLPNTLERNVVLAEHRAEIARLQKQIQKETKA